METYEKKYKDLVKRLNKAREEKGVYTFNSVLDAVAPELKIDESEDERIRKALINGFNKLDKSAVWYNGITNGQILALLEKQEQKPTEWSAAWSEEDVAMLDSAIAFVEHSAFTTIGKGKNNVIAWLKSIRDKVQPQPQPKQEWSEEDEENLNWFEKFFRAESVVAEGKDIPQDRYLWFKNLKERVQPQNTWKPSDEQMLAIDTAINVLGKGTLNGKQLIELQEQLKKLKS